MINTFFIADTHWGHKNIIGYNRPEFSCIEEMNEKLVENWNSVVRPKDNIFHLGDVAFGKDNLKYLERCNGNKKLIMGNHDTYDIEYYTPYFKKIFGVNQYKNALLSHIPVIWSQNERFELNIHGHVHHKDPMLMHKKFYYNVCADHINLTPVSWETIKEATKI